MADDTGAAKRPQPIKRLTPMRADKITTKRVDWLWKRWIPRGGLTMFTGDPQAGKSTILCEITARLSKGEPLPGEEPKDRPQPENVWIMSSEDRADDTIVWRLENQGADLAHVWITDKRIALTADLMKELKDTITTYNIAMVTIDTVTTWMGGDLDLNRANEVMDWAERLRLIAKETGCAIILVRHKRKGPPGDNKLHAGMGSIGLTAAVRAELMAFVKKDGSRVLEKTKGNVGAPPLPLAYEITDNPDPENPHGVLVWRGAWEDELEAAKAKPKPSKTPKAVALARDWLLVRLAPGPVAAAVLYAEAKERGITESTLKRAREGIAVSEQIGPNEWVWRLVMTETF